jgi:electron transport complex protein RnfG
MKNNYIGQAWLVLALALSFGAALAGVETWLKPVIAANKLAATVERIPTLVRGADANTSAQSAPLLVTVGEAADRQQYEAWRALTAEGEQVGWVIKASGKGFADKIELLIGVDASARRITGLHVLDQKETPGLGNKIVELGTRENKGFLWPFFHWEPAADQPLVVTTASPKMSEPGSANKITAVAGATISSRSVCRIVNEALSRELRDKLAASVRRAPARAPAAEE